MLVERFRFAPEVAFVLRGGVPLGGATIAPLTTPFEACSPLQAAIFASRKAAGSLGIPADLAVLDGLGTVGGAEGTEDSPTLSSGS